MKRSRAALHANHERWLVSYADFITLLFAFFVVLYASAQVDKHKAHKLSDAIHEGFKDLGAFSNGDGQAPSVKLRDGSQNAVPSITPTRSEVEHLRQQLETSLAEEILHKQLAVYLGRDGLVLSLREKGFFDSGSAQIRPEAMERFDRLARVLGEGPYRLRVEGHTDDLPIHNSRYASNWELSTARATEVVRLLVTRDGFFPDNLSAAGYAEFHPAGDNATEDGRQSNRRVDIVVLTMTPQ